MIKLRTHIISLTAVFLALGIGLMLGSTFLDRTFVDALDAQVVSAATKVMERILGGYPVDGWTMSRVQRLRRALGRMGT